ncbi:MAG: hypothetical protein NTW65_04055 [Deltaproteobacteria bacterium]|nr:hypothetical protein [Deltaproteobacteria bacterium]
MNKTFYGVISILAQIAAMIVGFIGIAKYSFGIAILFVAGCVISFTIFVYAFCTKCPIRDQCVHIVHGLLTNLMPNREQGAYSHCERLGTMLYFIFLVTFPQYWLINSPWLMALFWAILLSGFAINGIKVCGGCGNVYCPMRRRGGPILK